MKAAVLKTVGKIVTEDRPDPTCRGGDVILAVQACGLCRTDMKAYTVGQRDLRLPRVLGHEITGTVVEAGGSSPRFHLGDKVQVAPGVPCGSCRFCSQGWDHLCNRIEIMGFHRDGGFQEYLRIPARAVDAGILNIIPDGITFEEACMTEPLACAVNMQNSLMVHSGDTVLIWGGGPLGVMNSRLARSRGASTVILVEKNPDRLSRLQALESEDLLVGDAESLADRLQSLTGKTSVDVVIPCCPDPNALGQSLQICSKRGRIGFFSGLAPEPMLTNDQLNLIHYLELTMFGAYGCSIRDTQAALQQISAGDVEVQDMISSRIGLDDLQTALDLIALGKEMKIIMDIKKGRE